MEVAELYFGQGRTTRDRHLAEHVPGAPLADDALDPVDELDRLDVPFEQPEERALAALVNRVLARREADVGRRAREPLALVGAEGRKDRHAGNLVGRHHERQRNSATCVAARRADLCPRARGARMRRCGDGGPG
jgi:hypothetical protein